jgi:hypothetical protein
VRDRELEIADTIIERCRRPGLITDAFGLDDLRAGIAAALRTARQQRDAKWIEEADKAFEHVRNPLTDPAAIEGWAGDAVPAFVLHEVWKRNPRVAPLIDALVEIRKGSLGLAEADVAGHRWIVERVEAALGKVLEP